MMKNSICPEVRRVQLRIIPFIATLPPISLRCGELLRIEKVNGLYLFLLLRGPIFDKYYDQFLTVNSKSEFYSLCIPSLCKLWKFAVDCLFVWLCVVGPRPVFVWHRQSFCERAISVDAYFKEKVYFSIFQTQLQGYNVILTSKNTHFCFQNNMEKFSLISQCFCFP